MFGRRRRDEPATNPDTPSDETGPSDVALAETIARHFDGSRVEGGVAHIGLDGVSVECSVGEVIPFGSGVAASLFLRISGGQFGTHPIFASISGYGPSEQVAVVEGGCLWSCSFGPVLRAALIGGEEPEVDEFVATLDDRRFRVVVSGLDRLLGSTSNEPPDELIAAARNAVAGGARWLTRLVLEAGTLPVLVSDATIVSVFVMETPRARTVEIKINGRDWPASHGVLTAPSAQQGATMAMLRELAVLVPLEPPPPLTRASLDRTFAALDPTTAQPWQAEGWQGWWTHSGRLEPPMSESDLSVLEARTGRLPPDYRDFLLTVAAAGAGPGYGLVRPALHGNGVIPLAHAGCGVTWLLRLDDGHRGEVWVDAGGSDKTYGKVAGSFTEWYRAWLDTALRNGPWQQWDNRACATTAVFSDFITDLEQRGEIGPGPADLTGHLGPGAITLTMGAGYLPEGSAGDPCHPCVALAGRLGLTPDVFAPGILQGRAAGPVS